jgi:hypothetical protein
VQPGFQRCGPRDQDPEQRQPRGDVNGDPRTYMNLQPGNYRFEVAAVDMHENADRTPASFPWIVSSSSLSPSEEKKSSR